jgi:predicted DNA-binding ribbon-helix-helix protein
MTDVAVPEVRAYRGAPMRSFRLEDEVWARVQAEAARRETSASDVLRALAETLPA